MGVSQDWSTVLSVVIASIAAPIVALMLIIGAFVSAFAFKQKGRPLLQRAIWMLWIVALVPMIRLWTLESVTEKREIVVETSFRTGAICQDGWQSKSTGGGTCSSHGGVRYWTHHVTRTFEDTVPSRVAERERRRKEALPAYYFAGAMATIGLLSLRRGSS